MSYADYEIQFAVYFFHCTNVMVKCMPKNCFDGNFFKANIFFFICRQSSVAPFSTRNSSVGATGSASSALTSAHRSSPTIPSSSSCGSHNINNNNNNNLSSVSGGNNGGYSSDGDSDEE